MSDELTLPRIDLYAVLCSLNEPHIGDEKENNYTDLNFLINGRKILMIYVENIHILKNYVSFNYTDSTLSRRSIAEREIQMMFDLTVAALNRINPNGSILDIKDGIKEFLLEHTEVPAKNIYKLGFVPTDETKEGCNCEFHATRPFDDADHYCNDNCPDDCDKDSYCYCGCDYCWACKDHAIPYLRDKPFTRDCDECSWCAGESNGGECKNLQHNHMFARTNFENAVMVIEYLKSLVRLNQPLQ
jgi:hypothetical protein